MRTTQKRLERLETAAQQATGGEVLIFSQDLDNEDLYWRRLKDGSRQSLTRAEIAALDGDGPAILINYARDWRPEAQQGAESLSEGEQYG